MKSHIKQMLLAGLLTIPVLGLNAQWNMVRFDGLNTFSLVSTPQENHVFSIGTEPMLGIQFLLHSDDNGETWDSLAIGIENLNTAFAQLRFIDSQTGFLCGVYDNSMAAVLKTVDGGESWTDISPVVENYIYTVYFLNDQVGFAADFMDVYRTEDGGETWEIQGWNFRARDFEFVDESVGYVGGYGFENSQGVIQKTVDGGLNWEEVYSTSDPNLFVSEFTNLDVVDANTVVAHMNYTTKLHQTVNGGESWEATEVDSVWAIHDFDFISATEGRVLSPDGQIFVTTDNMNSWSMEYATEWGMYGPSVYLYDLSFDFGYGFVVGSNGLIKRITTGTSSVSEDLSPVGYSVYPNPLSVKDVLRINSTDAARLRTISIHNSAGVLVYSQRTTAGLNNHVALSLPELQPGLYTIMFHTVDRTFTEKLILLK